MAKVPLITLLLCVVIALSSCERKNEYDTLQEFVNDAVRKSWCYCESEEFEQEQLNSIDLQPDGDRGKEHMLWCIRQMNTKLDIRIEEINTFYQVYKPRWNDEAYAFDSDYNYFLFLWTTSA